MKTFETEKGNIPEGATHYFEETSEEHFAWWDDNNQMLLDPENANEWVRPNEFDDVSSPIEIPQTKEVEWVNGLPPIGEVAVLRYNFDSKTVTKTGLVKYASNKYCILDDGDGGEFSYNMCDYIYEKPETPEEKLERERIEAAKHLYVKHCVAVRHPFKDLDNNSELLNAWLVIVDETNYKVNGE